VSRKFILVSRWTLGAPPEAVWNLLREPERWPQWWPYVREVTLLRPGADDDLGAQRRFVWGSLLGYGLGLDITTTRVVRLRELEGRAAGDLDGVGTWGLAAQGSGTRVSYRWEVDLRKPWMRRAAPLLAPLFAWNHHGVMRAGARGMARRLGCRLEGYETADADGHEREDARRSLG
jgi:carbon monoxide dehydrogenase subunit G